MMDDKRERFEAAMHQMRDAFVEIKQARPAVDSARYNELVGEFFDGYEEVKSIFGDMGGMTDWAVLKRESVNFSEALQALKAGKRLRRALWNDLRTGQYVELAPASEGWHPWLILRSHDGQLVPYQPPTRDLFAEDWEIVP